MCRRNSGKDGDHEQMSSLGKHGHFFGLQVARERRCQNQGDFPAAKRTLNCRHLGFPTLQQRAASGLEESIGADPISMARMRGRSAGPISTVRSEG